MKISNSHRNLPIKSSVKSNSFVFLSLSLSLIASFSSERIFGYKNLHVNLYCLASSLTFYLNIDYEEKLNPKKYANYQADDIVKCLNPWIPSNTMTNLDGFLSKLKCEHDYSPFGEQIHSYELKGERATSYSIHRVNANFCDNQQFLEWYSRLETFLVFFIDAASTIDKEDSNWIIYLLYQQYRNIHGEICYTPMGFITVYSYYAYPDMKRPRISQVLILPPYQRKGHGRRLLTTIYDDLRKDSRVQDITGRRWWRKGKIYSLSFFSGRSIG